VTQQRKSEAATQLREVSKALLRESRLQSSLGELAARIAELQQQRQAAEQELAQLQAILGFDPALTAVARQMMDEAAHLRGSGDEECAVRNPKYVTSEHKRKLLRRILRDHHLEHPSASGMGFTLIRQVLQERYGIETASAGLFFRNELKEWPIRGGTKNREVVLDLERIGGGPASDES